ncbi:helix-turn-helix transcriptional regulator [Candidatus Sumerlaeota bacterium]|nr:helix-turn-helix transcriptional regulator [Candidatus Sumerlaeota bacterium]
MKTYLQEAIERVRGNPAYLAERALWDFVRTVTDRLALTGMTKGELAKRAGLDEAQLSRILAGNHNMTVKTLARIASAFGTDLSLRLESRICAEIPSAAAEKALSPEFRCQGQKPSETEKSDGQPVEFAA